MTETISGTGTSTTGTHGQDLEATHPLYDIFAPYYVEMTDSIGGRTPVIGKDEDYLPMPGGMKLIKNSTDKAAAYSAFQKRATYPEIVAPTVRGLGGIMHSTPIKPELPTALEYMLEKATSDGLTLEATLRRITKNVLEKGRTGIAIAISKEDGKARLAIYTAINIRNWDDDETMVVLDESGPEMNENLSWDDKTKRLLIELKDGKATSTLYDLTAGGTSDDPTEYVGSGVNVVNFLPFVYVNTSDLTPDPDEVPLLPLARLTFTYFRQDANYQQAMTNAANPMPVVSGMAADDPNRPQVFGGGAICFLPESEQSMNMLEYTGRSIGDMRQALQDTKDAMIQAGASMFATADEPQESGSARKMKFAARTATIVNVLQTSVAGLIKALKMCAIIEGANPKEVSIPISTDFIDSTLTAQEMDSFGKQVMGGNMSKLTNYEQMQVGNRANPDRTWEEEERLIEEQGPDLGMVGREVVKEDDEK